MAMEHRRRKSVLFYTRDELERTRKLRFHARGSCRRRRYKDALSSHIIGLVNRLSAAVWLRFSVAEAIRISRADVKS